MRIDLKPRNIERIIFVILLAFLAVGGGAYELLRTSISSIILVPMILAYFAACYMGYRLLEKALRNKEIL
jgi:hypothetical protein